MDKQKNCYRLAAVLITLAVLFFAACSGDSIALEELPPDPLVNFKVNAAGTAFENTGTNKGVAAPTVSGGEFESVHSLKVFNTKGTQSGQSEIPWWEGNYWNDYTDIGYVDLGSAAGDLLASLESFTIETYFKQPDNAQSDRGTYIWSFGDQAAPANAVWFNYRDLGFIFKVSGTDEEVVSDWNTASSKHTPGTWHHLVVTLGGGTAAIYLDSAFVNSGPVAQKPTDIGSGVLDTNYLAKSLYEGAAYDQTIFDTQFYSFAIYEGAVSANQIAYLYQKGPMKTLRGN
jgi:hypothetical protein